MSQECSRLQEEEAIRWMAVPHSVESTGQESGRGGRDEQGTEERRVIFISSAAASHRMVLRVGEKSDLLCRLLWTQPPHPGCSSKGVSHLKTCRQFQVSVQAFTYQDYVYGTAYPPSPGMQERS